jgi:hypothetical protein
MGGGSRRDAGQTRALRASDNIDPGNCQVTFPNLDKDAWQPK